MHTQNWAKDLLYSLPIAVEFAGFRGNTLSLAKAGWDLSMRQCVGYSGDYEMELAMRHGGANLYAISNRVCLPYGEFLSSASSQHEWAEYLTRICFFIHYVSTEIQFRIMPRSENSLWHKEFMAIDPFPQVRDHEVSIKDFKFFKVSNPKLQDIIVDPNQVPELLDMVLKAQMPQQELIKRNERSRQNMEAYRADYPVKPSHVVQAQIITLNAG